MGRKALPIDMHKARGNPNRLTKAEIERREKGEIKLGKDVFRMPTAVKAMKEAARKWKELIKLYEGVGYVTSADIDTIAQYCITHAQYMDLVKHRAQSQMVDFALSEGMKAQEKLMDYMGDDKGKRFWIKLEYLMSLDGVMEIDRAINAKIGILIKLGDRLLINPVSRVKNIPKKPNKPKADPLEKAGFANI